jgi:hypothetical protein
VYEPQYTIGTGAEVAAEVLEEKSGKGKEKDGIREDPGMVELDSGRHTRVVRISRDPMTISGVAEAEDAVMISSIMVSPEEKGMPAPGREKARKAPPTRSMTIHQQHGSMNARPLPVPLQQAGLGRETGVDVLQSEVVPSAMT